MAKSGGFVARYMGDGVLTFFGYPHAHEDDAERAVRSSLTVLAEVSGLHALDGTPLQMRRGIATGLVVVDDLSGDGPAQEKAGVGESFNFTARLQARAEPNVCGAGVAD
jgi:class 3 adenylate cyclase